MTGDRPRSALVIPEALAASHARHFGAASRAWLAGLPELAAAYLARWELRPDGEPWCGAVALVLPVRLADSTPAALKLQPVDQETAGEPLALASWRGRGAVLLLRHDPATGTMLLERLVADHTLTAVPDDLAALQILSELLARLTAIPAPSGMRRLADLAAAMIETVPRALAAADPRQRALLTRCADAVAELLPEAGDRLLHWDLHYDNVLRRPASDDQPWAAIDPKPLAGDPGFELLAALHNRWDEVVATGDVRRAIRRRFDLMTEVLGLDRRRAAGWTLGRVLQNLLWEIENGERGWHAAPDRAIGSVLLDQHWLAGRPLG